MQFIQRRKPDGYVEYEVHIQPEDIPDRDAFTARIRQTLTEEEFPIPASINGTNTNKHFIELFAVIAESYTWNYTLNDDAPVFMESFKVGVQAIYEWQTDEFTPELEQCFGLLLRFLDDGLTHLPIIVHRLAEYASTHAITPEEATLMCLTSLYSSDMVGIMNVSTWFTYVYSCEERGLSPQLDKLKEYEEMCSTVNHFSRNRMEEEEIAAGLISNGTDPQDFDDWMLSPAGSYIRWNANKMDFLRDNNYNLEKVTHMIESLPEEILNELYDKTR